MHPRDEVLAELSELLRSLEVAASQIAGERDASDGDACPSAPDHGAAEETESSAALRVLGPIVGWPSAARLSRVLEALGELDVADEAGAIFDEIERSGSRAASLLFGVGRPKGAGTLREIATDAEPEDSPAIAARIREAARAHPEFARAIMTLGATAAAAERWTIESLRELATRKAGVEAGLRVDAAWRAELRARHLTGPAQNQGLVGPALDLELFLRACPDCDPRVRDDLVAALAVDGGGDARLDDDAHGRTLRAIVAAWAVEIGELLAARQSDARMRRLGSILEEPACSGDAGGSHPACPRRRLAALHEEVRMQALLQRRTENAALLIARAVGDVHGLAAADRFIVAFRRAAAPRAFDIDDAEVAARSVFRAGLAAAQLAAIEAARAEALREEAAIGAELMAAAWADVDAGGFGVLPVEGSEPRSLLDDRYRALRDRLAAGAERAAAKIVTATHGTSEGAVARHLELHRRSR
ncbi:MAG TPA: hypothetical protein PKC43_09215 [Phycisphaerales bacterium]|nr:hypothetical protein [Phycisphaerales bacterium]HMP37614.1 hypothetical protein [Phycisphaerales bacterium]